MKIVEDQATQAMLQADTAAIDRIFSDNWLIIDENADIRDKHEEFDAYKTGEEKVTAAQLDDLKVRMFGDSAVVTGRYLYRGSFQGKPFDTKGRFTDVFVKEAGRWRCVSSHNSSFPKSN